MEILSETVRRKGTWRSGFTNNLSSLTVIEMPRPSRGSFLSMTFLTSPTPFCFLSATISLKINVINYCIKYSYRHHFTIFEK